MDPYALDADGLADLLDGEPGYRVQQVRQWLARGVADPTAMTDLPGRLRDQLAAVFDAPPQVLRHSTADDGLTHKLLLGMTQGVTISSTAAPGASEAVESVLMLYPRRGRHDARATVCVSTQAGCALGCPFCATGQAGFRRQLSVGEIVTQVTVMQRRLAAGEFAAPAAGPLPKRVTNVVFMGMGEPLANLEPTVAAIRWLHAELGLSARAVTVSTVGLVPGIRRLGGLGLPITLAVSLHAADDALRDDLVPVNRQWPLADVLAAAKDYRDRTGRRVTFEYILIDAVNAGPEHARRLATLLVDSGFAGAGVANPAHVNLIPMNPTPAVPWHAPSGDDQQAFAAELADAGIAVTIRHNRGDDIDAACGQLYADYRQGSGRMLPAARGAAQRVVAADASDAPGPPTVPLAAGPRRRSR